MQRTSWFAYLCQVQDTKGSKQIKKKYAQFGNAVASCVDEWLSHMTHQLLSARCAPTDTMTLLQLWLHFNAEFFPWVTSLPGTFLPETVMAKPSRVNQDLIKIGPSVILTPVCALWKQSAGFQPADWAAPSLRPHSHQKVEVSHVSQSLRAEFLVSCDVMGRLVRLHVDRSPTDKEAKWM